jgi:cell division protein FtsZ
VVEEEKKKTVEKRFQPLQEKDLNASSIQQTEETENLAPKIVETPGEENVKLPINKSEITVDNSSEEIIRFELSSDYNPESSKIHLNQNERAENVNKSKETKDYKDASTAKTSGGFLAKPKHIYAEDKPQPESETPDKPNPLPISKQEDEPVEEMQLVVKNSSDAADRNQEEKVRQTKPIMMSTVEEPPMVDETEELKRRAMDRIAKLRNLSFNVNAADPNNEFESVPAYLRRNTELQNSIADIESFYSNYTVKSDENNKAEISTINTFLDGEKPD